MPLILICGILLKKVLMRVPSKLIGNMKVPKKADEYDKEESKKMTSNFRLMNILCCALDTTEYIHDNRWETTKAIWNFLEVAHKGTNQVKESKLGILVRNYELFSVK